MPAMTKTVIYSYSVTGMDIRVPTNALFML